MRQNINFSIDLLVKDFFDKYNPIINLRRDGNELR